MQEIKLTKGEKVNMKDSPVAMCFSHKIPPGKKYRETQYSTRKTRNGKESVPFLNLPGGIHLVRFYNNKKEVILRVQTWVSMYGDAWCILNNDKVKLKKQRKLEKMEDKNEIKIITDTDRLNFLLENYIIMSRDGVTVLGNSLRHDLEVAGNDRDFIIGGSIRKLIDINIRKGGD